MQKTATTSVNLNESTFNSISSLTNLTCISHTRAIHLHSILYCYNNELYQKSLPLRARYSCFKHDLCSPRIEYALSTNDGTRQALLVARRTIHAGTIIVLGMSLTPIIPS